MFSPWRSQRCRCVSFLRNFQTVLHAYCRSSSPPMHRILEQPTSFMEFMALWCNVLGLVSASWVLFLAALSQIHSRRFNKVWYLMLHLSILHQVLFRFRRSCFTFWSILQVGRPGSRSSQRVYRVIASCRRQDPDQPYRETNCHVRLLFPWNDQ